MRKCIGASAVSINGFRRETRGRKNWAFPPGEVEKNETFEECCKWEVEEETCYKVEVVEKFL